MSNAVLAGARIAAVAAAVPRRVSTEADLGSVWEGGEVRRIVAGLGVRNRRIAKQLCTSDLCLAAAESLFASSGLDRQQVDGLIFVSQTPDYILPASSCVLHGKLGLSRDCASFDVSLGCSGYVYGLWLAASLVCSGALRRVLILAGDTISRCVSKTDRATMPLFGDAGTATIVESAHGAAMCFVLGSDGSGAGNLIIPESGFRRCRQDGVSDSGGVASPVLQMNGAEIFAFTLREVPGLVSDCLELAGWSLADCERFVFHQANEFMLRHLAGKIGVPNEKLVVGLGDFGNTSSASIPLALVTEEATSLRERERRYLLAGFGVGYSWGAAAAQIGEIFVSDLVEVSEATC